MFPWFSPWVILCLPQGLRVTIQYDPIWSNMIQYYPIWSNMIQYDPINSASNSSLQGSSGYLWLSLFCDASVQRMLEAQLASKWDSVSWIIGPLGLMLSLNWWKVGLRQDMIQPYLYCSRCGISIPMATSWLGHVWGTKYINIVMYKNI